MSRTRSLALVLAVLGAVSSAAHAQGLMTSKDRDAWVRRQNAAAREQAKTVEAIARRLADGAHESITYALPDAVRRAALARSKQLRPAQRVDVATRIARGEKVLHDPSLTHGEWNLAHSLYRQRGEKLLSDIAHQLIDRPPGGYRIPGKLTARQAYDLHRATVKDLRARR
jgi:hypothetical protein